MRADSTLCPALLNAMIPIPIPIPIEKMRLFDHLQGRWNLFMQWCFNFWESKCCLLAHTAKNVGKGTSVSHDWCGCLKSRYKSSTPTSQELSSSIFQGLSCQWVSEWGIGNIRPDLHSVQLIKPYIRHNFASAGFRLESLNCLLLVWASPLLHMWARSRALKGFLHKWDKQTHTHWHKYKYILANLLASLWGETVKFPHSRMFKSTEYKLDWRLSRWQHSGTMAWWKISERDIHWTQWKGRDYK